MIRQPLFRHIAMAALCVFAQNAIAQDVIVKPAESGTTSGQGGSSWFSIFSPSKDSAKKPETPQSSRTLPTGQPGVHPAAPNVDISKLPPEAQKAYRAALQNPLLQQKGQENAGSILKKPDMATLSAVAVPTPPDLKDLDIPEEAKRQYISEAKKLAEKIKSLQRSASELKPVEIAMPDPTQGFVDHKFERQLGITMTNAATLSEADTNTASAFFEIPPESVRQLCDLKLFTRAMAKGEIGDPGEEIRGGQAVARYDGDTPKLSFEAYARCRLNKISENVFLRIKEHDRYLYRLGLSECQAPDSVRTPTSVKVEYLGGGKVRCNF